jgi:hypothetical protein
MKRTFGSLFVVLLFIIATSCAGSKGSSKEVFTPEGSWSTLIQNTPLGDMGGTMNIRPNGDAWAGELTASGYGTFTLRNVKIADRKMTATFSFEGFDLDVEGNFVDDDTLSGTVYAMGDGFPFKGTRIKN